MIDTPVTKVASHFSSKGGNRIAHLLTVEWSNNTRAIASSPPSSLDLADTPHTNEYTPKLPQAETAFVYIEDVGMAE